MKLKNSFQLSSPVRLRRSLIVIAMVIVVAAVLYATNLARRLAFEEHRKMEIWAEATRQLLIADEQTEISFMLYIIERNTTIPVYMVDSEGNILLSRNVKEPKQNIDNFYKNKIRKLQDSQQPIEVQLDDGLTQYIYYEESTLLKQLQYFPYILFTIILLFFFVSVYLLYTVQHSEQDKVWVGLCKETAHQLGTPISSLSGWQELLMLQYPEDTLIPEIGKDISRLQTIAERFSKVGSVPELKPTNLQNVLEKVVDYMDTRTSDKVKIRLVSSAEDYSVMLNEPLFSWVIENLCKNAVDAIEGEGKITITTDEEDNKINIDISDTGRGIASKNIRKIFLPGYTTKQRGWGLGLSLAKRIVEEYHGGKIFVLKSELDVGTTFRLQLLKAAAAE